jgi:hypothetical protein
MERVWMIAATLCLIAAALFLWRARLDERYMTAAFVAATLGILAWFLRLRSQLRKIIPPDPNPTPDEIEDTEEQDEN